MDAVSRVFGGGCSLPEVTDAGDWTLLLTNEQGRSFAFSGPLLSGVCEETDALSNAIRAALGRNDLLAFDGAPDAVERTDGSVN